MPDWVGGIVLLFYTIYLIVEVRRYRDRDFYGPVRIFAATVFVAIVLIIGRY